MELGVATGRLTFGVITVYLTCLLYKPFSGVRTILWIPVNVIKTLFDPTLLLTLSNILLTEIHPVPTTFLSLS